MANRQGRPPFGGELPGLLKSRIRMPFYQSSGELRSHPFCPSMRRQEDLASNTCFCHTSFCLNFFVLEHGNKRRILPSLDGAAFLSCQALPKKLPLPRTFVGSARLDRKLVRRMLAGTGLTLCGLALPVCVDAARTDSPRAVHIPPINRLNKEADDACHDILNSFVEPVF